MIEEIGGKFHDFMVDARRNIDSLTYRREQQIAEGALLKLHAAGEEGQTPIKTFESGYLDFGRYEPGSVFRVNHVMGSEDAGRKSYSWYAVGRSGEKPLIYILINYPKAMAKLRGPKSPVLKLEPDWEVAIVRDPEITAFHMDQAQSALSGSLLDPPNARVREWQKNNPDNVYRVESIDLMTGGVVEKRKARKPSTQRTILKPGYGY